MRIPAATGGRGRCVRACVGIERAQNREEKTWLLAEENERTDRDDVRRVSERVSECGENGRRKEGRGLRSELVEKREGG